jgi:hypothetical protein
MQQNEGFFDLAIGKRLGPEVSEVALASACVPCDIARSIRQKQSHSGVARREMESAKTNPLQVIST